MNYITTSTGERMNRTTFDNRVRNTKKLALIRQVDQYGFNFCSKCKRSSGVYLDCSHNESVDKCIKNGYPEKAYNINNITILCRSCHQYKDKLYTQWTN